MKRYHFISVLRVLAMLSIVAGHICTFLDIYLFDLGGVGIYSFLAISGFLYGNRVIENTGKWLVSRVKRIMIPVWIWTILLFVLGMVIDTAHYDLLLCLFGVQGLPFFTPVSFEVYRPMAHTWFITVILLCYLMTALIGTEKTQGWVDHNKRVIFPALCLVQIVLVYFGFQIIFFNVFFAGYIIARLKDGKLNTRAVLSFLTMLMLGIIRIMWHRYGAENVFYNRIIVSWSGAAIGIFSLCFFEWFGSKVSMEKLSESKGWKYLDKLSFPIYIVHYCLLHGFLQVGQFTGNRAMQIALCIFFTEFSAVVLDKVNGIIEKHSNRLLGTY